MAQTVWALICVSGKCEKHVHPNNQTQKPLPQNKTKTSRTETYRNKTRKIDPNRMQLVWPK